jgi:hypothetical protein
VTTARRAQSSAGTQTLRKNPLQGVHQEKGECQEGENNLVSRNPLDLSYQKSLKRKECEKLKPSQRQSSGGIALFRSVVEVWEMDS